jgi:predicted DNA-binding transcriptional regulator YafY
MAKAIRRGRPSRRRAARLYRLLKSLNVRARSRSQLVRSLRVGTRTFYRDLELLRRWGIAIPFEQQRYRLAHGWSECLKRLPFPDPQLSFAEVRALASTRTSAGRKLKKLLTELTK